LSVSEYINDCSGKNIGTPPLECLGPVMLYKPNVPSLVKSVNTVSPPSASILALSLGTLDRLYLTLASFVSLKLVFL